MVVGEELGKTASLDLFLEEVKLVKKHDKGLPLEVDVVHDGGKQVQTLVHPVGLIVLVKKLKIKVESEVASRHHEVPRRDADFVCACMVPIERGDSATLQSAVLHICLVSVLKEMQFLPDVKSTDKRLSRLNGQFFGSSQMMGLLVFFPVQNRRPYIRDAL